MIASRFRVMCADAGLSIDGVAKLLHVTPRTVRYWFSGQSAVPYAAYRLVRVQRWFELPQGFEGWCMHSGKLWTPEGHPIAPEDGTWWSLIVRQARCFRTLYERSRQLDRALLLTTDDGRAALGLPPLQHGPGGSAGARADALARGSRTGRTDPARAAGRAAEPPGLDLSLGHLGTQRNTGAAGKRPLTKAVQP